MYAWYFPKAFYGRFPTGRRDWTSAIVWIDNPDFPNASVRGLSLANAVSGYAKHVPPQEGVIENGTTPKFGRFTATLKGYPEIETTVVIGDVQDLVMWGQLTDAARTGLNTMDFGKAKVPFNDDNFAEMLEKAWPF